MKTLPVAVLVLAVSWACGSSPIVPQPPDNLLPPAPQEPAPTQYQVSGVVTDENGSAVTNAAVELYYAGPEQSQPTFLLYTGKLIRTRTGGDGRYNATFEPGSSRFLGNANVVGVVRTRRGGGTGGNDTQLLPAGAADIVRDLRYRHVPTIDAGGGIAVSIEPDSSRLVGLSGDVFGTSNPVDLSRLKTTFRITIGTAGTLTVRVQAGIAATLQAHCSYGPEECSYAFTPSSSGSISGQVESGTIYEISVSIPSTMVPQRFTLSTSLTP